MDSVGVNDNFIESLKSHFAFGIRIASPIEMMRFKRFYADDYGMDCSWTDEEIMDKIQRNCFIHELIETVKKVTRREIATKCILTRMTRKLGELFLIHVLTAIGFPEEYARGIVRISLGAENTKEEVGIIVTQLIQIVESMNEGR